MANLSFPVQLDTMLVEDGPNKEVYYPQLVGLENRHIERKINQTIFAYTEHLYQQQFAEQEVTSFAEMTGSYEVKTNERHLISLTLFNYAIAPQAANGLTKMTSLTFHTKTGQQYRLKDLFKDHSNYIEVLSEHIKQQVLDRDIPTIERFKQISPNQSFYLADKCIVLYFQALEYTPHYVGIPVFPINAFYIEDIINEEGPLAILLPSV